MGVETMLCEAKAKYHIVKANKLALKIVKNCSICRRVQGKTSDQLMAELPKDRLTCDDPVFACTILRFEYQRKQTREEVWHHLHMSCITRCPSGNSERSKH